MTYNIKVENWSQLNFVVDIYLFSISILGRKELNIHIYIVPKFSIHKALYSCDMEAADAEAAQTETLKKLCAKDKCDVDPKAIFDTSSCPGMQL